MSRQDQKVEGGEAYQAGNNVTVYRGMSPDQMTEIMVALAGQLSSYFMKAEETAQSRYTELREELLSEFAKQDFKGRTDAFSDPDYQFIVKEAHDSFARSGDRSLKDELVRLLVERSNQKTGSRTALILNDAIRTSGSLTFEEMSVLATVFMMKAVSVTAPNINAVADRYELMLQPFVDNLTDEVFAFEYLESLGCITIERVADHFPLDEHMYRRFSDIIPKEMTKEQLWKELTHSSRSLRVVGELWPKAFYRQSMLTALGKALAHSALESKRVMDAPLSIWVR